MFLKKNKKFCFFKNMLTYVQHSALKFLSLGDFSMNENIRKEARKPYGMENNSIFLTLLLQRILLNHKKFKSKKKIHKEDYKIKEIENKIFSFCNQGLFSSIENNYKVLSFLIFSLKSRWKGKLNTWVSSLLQKKLSSVYFWQICILSELENKKGFKILDKIIILGLNVSGMNICLIKDFFRFKILFLKSEISKPECRYKDRFFRKSQWTKVFFTFFCSVLKVNFSGKLLYQLVQLYAKESWAFPELGRNFGRIFNLIKSNFNDKKSILLPLFSLFIHFFFFRCHFTNKTIQKTGLYLETIDLKWTDDKFKFFKTIFLLKKKNKRRMTRKKGNSKQLLSIFSFLK